ncbi:glucan phosphoethanolaminetransferase (alkaline phosphatase superfamily) [Dysgonomonas sp. PH5-45]|uniref:DUF4293 domain-containing protein n=1 Tax=unclassified Dysgonomonas TaxID=2630389 RepID=UPI002473EDC0|nr:MULTISPECIES: DUF4293 domain-containing protein [unclassified Dysgonomonas]MDH6354938.1 glucan phosphoethanolaminetransferase (alkaline phosphatase superfamily) [Dysgonomonas sp. PH5-45]MDH6387837.1 glucan phosphoethanolaminetransferase (alkaline phosphatase superfamily) [Dysgonomonas sp. PH5-37]
MIQRIQSVYLLLVAILMAVAAFLPLAELKSTGVLYEFEAAGIFFEGHKVFATWGVITFAVLSALASFANIFLYKKRKVQISVCAITLLFIMLFYVAFGVYMNVAVAKLNAEFLGFEFGISLPAIAFILNILAWHKIKADEKLVRSLDRIR